MKLMVIDGNSIINRAFYGVRLLSTKEGLYTNAIFGFLNILQKLLEEERPEALCVTFDRKAPTFRHQAFEGYKAQRKGMPEELAVQMPILKDVLRAMNIPMYELDGWEADDLIGTISRKCEGADWDCVAVTGDKDSLQLITPRTSVKLVVTRMGQTTTRLMTPELFREEYGFDPIHLIDLKALMGDSSDNYPGVPGIGEKTALELVRTYGSVENLYANLETAQLKPAQRRKLEEGADSARLCYDLATIRTDAPLDFAPQENLRREWDKGAVYELFLKLEFSKFIEKYGLTPGTEREELPQVRVESETVTDPARLRELLEEWQSARQVYCLALPSLDGVAVEWEAGENIERSAFVYQPNLGEAYNEFLTDFFSEKVKKVSHDIKPLMHRLLAEGLFADGFVFDTALAAYLLSPTDGSYELDKLFVAYYNQEIKPQVDYTDPEAFAPLNDPAQAEASILAHTSAVAALYKTMAPKLSELGMEELYNQVELPLCRVLAEMELAGVLVDRKALVEFGAMLDEGIRRSQEAVFSVAGEEFNLNSTRQLGVLLFEKLGLPPVKKTKTGYSTNADVLEKLRGSHPVIEAILEYRQLSKLKSTYVDGLTKVIAPDGRIHTSFQNTVTATGRLSSMEPNLQNIPVRTPLGAEMRKMFIAAPGNVLVDADYSQIELRLLAHIADDGEMQKAFGEGVDIHTVTASQVFGVPVEEVTKQMRSSAKAVNFGIVYGISDFSLSQDIGVTRREAKAYMDKYFAHYAGVRAYMDHIVAEGKEQGYVSTLMGRRRWLPELKSSNFNLRSFGERVALNMPIQGTAADIIKLAMIRVDRALKDAGLKGRLVLQVHDELIVECPEEEGERVLDILRREMEGVAQLKVPLQVDGAVGNCWADAH